jgi:hypothetical protein
MKPHQINSDKAGLFTGRKGVRFQLLLTSAGGSLSGVWILAMAPDGSCLVGAEKLHRAGVDADLAAAPRERQRRPYCRFIRCPQFSSPS